MKNIIKKGVNVSCLSVKVFNFSTTAKQKAYAMPRKTLIFFSVGYNI